MGSLSEAEPLNRGKGYRTGRATDGRRDVTVGRAETLKLVRSAVAVFTPAKKFLSHEGIVFWNNPVPTGGIEWWLEVCPQRQHQA